jgi:hypothetical protein
MTHLCIPAPALTEKLINEINTTIPGQISLVELSMISVGIEYFSMQEDRSVLRQSYIAAISDRFKQLNLGNKSDTDIILQSIGSGVLLPVHTTPFFSGRPTPTDKRYIDWYRQQQQSRYLKIVELIDRCYHAVTAYYQANRRIDDQLKDLAKYYIGVFPTIKINADGSFMLNVIGDRCEVYGNVTT